MAEEIELKLDLTPDAADALEASGLLGAQTGRADFETCYFDTADRSLRDAGLSLRIRRAGDRRIQTVKGGQARAAGLFVRPEWERPVVGDTPVLDERTPIPMLLHDRTEDIAPVFALTVERRTWAVPADAGALALVIDRGLIRAGDRTAPVCEVELELETGDTRQLFAFARRIDRVAPVRLGVLSKAEQGFLLLEPERPACKAEPVPLDPGMDAAAAFQAILRSCLRHYRRNEAILLRQRSPEALHQARVALRRLRSAFSILRKAVDDGEADALAARVRALANALGEARDLDVLIGIAQPGGLRDRLVAAREQAQAGVDRTLASAATRALMLDLAEWLASGAWLDDPATRAWREAPARDVAAETLERLRRRVKRRGRKLAAIDDEARHDLRKESKKLRYAADFFSPLFGRKKERRRMKRFVAALEALQDELGALNDQASAPRLLKRLGIANDPEAGPEAGRLLAGTDRKDRLEAAADAHRNLVDTKRYWKG